MAMKSLLVAFLALMIGLGSGLVASADTIQFTNFTHSGSDAVDWVVSIDDDTAGVFTVNVGIDPSSPNIFADITGVAFSISGAISGGLLATHIVDTTSPASDWAASYIGPASKFGEGSGQVNFEGGSIGLFDAALGYASGPLMLTSVRFTVSNLGGVLDLSDWTKFGVRSQSVGDTEFGTGSSKDWSTTASAVPAPSGIVGLLGLAATLGGLTFWRKRQ